MLTERGPSLPLLIRKYQKGKLSPVLVDLESNKEVKISGYKGPGLRFGDIKPGRVILIGGGTGCYPFYDLFDLLYKAKLAESNADKRQEIYALDPVLETNPFAQYKFVFYGGFEQESDIHHIIYEQLGELAKDKTFKCVLRIKGQT